MKSFDLNLDVSSLDGLAQKLSRLDTQSLGAGLIGAVNQVADRAYASTRNDMLRSINLSMEYVESKMRVEPAKNPANIVASIVATGPDRGKNAGAILGRYSPVMLTRPTRRPKRSKGDLSNERAIPKGSKAAGLQVQVHRGSPKTISHGFTMRLRGSGQIGVFTRERGGPLRHRYGPSVYQLFGVAADRLLDDVGADLEATISSEATRLLERALR